MLSLANLGLLTRRRFRRFAIAAVLLLAVAAFAVATPVYAAHPERAMSEHRQPHTSTFKVGTEYRIHDGSGTAFNITDKDDHRTASLDLTVKVEKTNFARVKLTVESGTLTIGSDSFTVKAGNGIINLHSMKVVIHARVDDGKGHVMHLILFGHLTKLNSDGSATINFVMPQSKLAHEWFLELKGATMTKI